MTADDPKDFLLQLAKLMISEKGGLVRMISVPMAMLFGAIALRIAGSNLNSNKSS
jgi:hypothetical protein